MATKVEVTKEDIARAAEARKARRKLLGLPAPIPIEVDQLCPVYQALVRTFRFNPVVEFEEISWDGRHCRKRYATTKKIREFLTAWDNLGKVNPITFYLRKTVV